MIHNRHIMHLQQSYNPTLEHDPRYVPSKSLARHCLWPAFRLGAFQDDALLGQQKPAQPSRIP